jgi:hypothetical protein
VHLSYHNQFNSNVFAGMTAAQIANALGGHRCGDEYMAHLRAAIQSLSGNVQKRIVLAHLGWHREGKRQVFVHAGGTIGPIGPQMEQYYADDIHLPRELENFRLPELPSKEDLQKAIRESIDLTKLAHHRVRAPTSCERDKTTMTLQ